MLSNLTVPLAGLIDTALLGHLTEVKYLAGVALGSILFDFIYWLFGFFRMSTTGLTAQAVGAKHIKNISLIPLRGLIMAFVTGFIILILSSHIADAGFWILHGSDEVIEQGRLYFQARIWGAPAVLMNFVFIGWLLGKGLGKKVLILSMIANGTNIILDVLLIFKLGLGSQGAGLATMISQYLMLIGALWFCLPTLVRSRHLINWSHILDKAELKNLIALNRDIFIRTLTLITSFSYFTNASSGMGVVILATNAILLKILSIASYFIDGLAFAIESVAGRFKGAGNTKSMNEAIRLALWSGLGTGFFFAALFNLFPNHLFLLLTNQAPVLEELQRYCLWLFPVMLLGSVAYIWDGVFLGLSEGKKLRNCMLISAAVAFFPLAVYASHGGFVHLLWLSMTLFMGLRSLTLWWSYGRSVNA